MGNAIIVIAILVGFIFVFNCWNRAFPPDAVPCSPAYYETRAAWEQREAATAEYHRWMDAPAATLAEEDANVARARAAWGKEKAADRLYGRLLRLHDFRGGHIEQPCEN